MDITELEQYSLKDAVQLHRELNPQLFDGDQLRPDVRRALLRIADDFREYLGLSASQIDDITVSGSNAGYTYTPYSDIDLHLIIDMKRLDNDEVYRELFDAKKSLYNDRYDIKVKDADVELYVQGAADQHHSAGVYSLSRDQWQKMPRRQRVPIDDNTVQAKYKKLGHAIEQAVKNPDYDKLSALLDKIKRMRKAGLDRAGEFSAENLVFKLLRNRGLIKQLIKARDQAKSQELSIEEAAYAGNIGIMELNEFYRKATPEQKKLLGQLIKQGQQREIWDLVKRVTGMEIMTEFRWGFQDEPLQEAASGYIPSEAERDDPRFSNALTVDIRPDSLKKAAQQLGFRISRAGVPPRARTNGKLTEGRVAFRGVDSRLSSEINRAIPNILRSLELKPDQVPPVTFTSDRSWAKDHTTFGVTQWKNTADDSEVYVYVGDRYLADVLRTYTHELQHVKQFINGVAHHDMDSQELAQVEADANTVAGRVMVDYGKQHNKIFTDLTESYHNQKSLDELAVSVKKLSNPNYDNIDAEMQRIAKKYSMTAKQLHDQWVAKYGVSPDAWVRGSTTEVLDEDQDLLEVKMSPGELEKWANSEEAEGIQAGFEAELIFRDTSRDDDEGESEADMDADERAYSIESVLEFFMGGDNGIGRNTANRVRDRLYEEMYDWQMDQIDQEWEREEEDQVRDWMRNNIDPEQYRDQAMEELGIDGDATEEQVAAIDQRAAELFDQAIDSAIENQDDNYDRARDEFYDYRRDDTDYDEESFLSDRYRYMSDIGDAFSIDWPYWTEGSSGNGGSRTPEEIANSLSSELGGAEVRASSGYHSTSRKPGRWIIEPDGSLDPDDYEDAGLEVVSPPMPLPEALRSLRTVIDWANSDGDAYTNGSTGLHMGVSIPHKGGDVDYVKLILFLGDRYVLDQFGRSANSYTRSALDKLKDVQRSRRSTNEAEGLTGAEKTAAAMELMKRNLIELAQRYVQDGVGRDKYTSAHIKDGYIEFRSPGGDYLSMDSRDESALANTMLRFARAMYIAGRPDLERKEYAKKLYQLIDTQGDDALKLFMDYTTGQINQEELKKNWARQVLAKEQPRKVEQEYEVYDKNTGETLETLRFARGEGEGMVSAAIADAIEKYSGQGMDISLRPVGEPEVELSPRAKIAKKISGRPTWYWVEAGDQLIMVQAHNTEEAKQRAREQDNHFMKYKTITVTPATAEEVKRYQEKIRDNAQDRRDIEQRVQGSSGEQRYLVQWTERRDGRDITDSLGVTARNADAAMASVRSALEAQGRRPTTISADTAPIAGSTLDLAQQRAARAAAQSQGEWTGHWIVQDGQGRELTRFHGIGNNQSDANRHAARWLGTNRPDLAGQEIEVVPEIR